MEEVPFGLNSGLYAVIGAAVVGFWKGCLGAERVEIASVFLQATTRKLLRFFIVSAEFSVAKTKIRYNFGTAEAEISEERICKGRSARHLEFLPSLLEE